MDCLGAGQQKRRLLNKGVIETELWLVRVLGQDCWADWGWVGTGEMGQPWKALEAELGFGQSLAID